MKVFFVCFGDETKKKNRRERLDVQLVAVVDGKLWTVIVTFLFSINNSIQFECVYTSQKRERGGRYVVSSCQFYDAKGNPVVVLASTAT